MHKKIPSLMRLRFNNAFNVKLMLIIYVLYVMLYGFFLDAYNGVLWFDYTVTHSFKTLIIFGREAIFTKIGFYGAIMLYCVYYLFNRTVFLYSLNYKNLSTASSLSNAEQKLISPCIHVAQEMGLKYAPQILLSDAPYPNALAGGFLAWRHYIYLTQGLIDCLNEEELQAVIANQVAQIKLKNTNLLTALAIVSFIPLIAFDILFYNYLFVDKKPSKSNSVKNMLILCRFFLPLPNIAYRLFFTSERYHHANVLACQYLNNHSYLISALAKIEKNHMENKEHYSKLYTTLSLDALRSNSYLFSTTDYHYSQTFADIYALQPSIDQQIDFLLQNENLKIKCTLDSPYYSSGFYETS